jgi:chaperonin GroES
MATPKSEKLQKEEKAGRSPEVPEGLATVMAEQDGPIQVREVQCLNDFVAILQFEVDMGSIVVPDSDSKYKFEGLVVGVGPGVSDNAGGRLPPQLSVGDVVMFGKNIVAQIASDSPPYAGHKIVLVSERNVLCKLHKQLPWERYKGD